jgi:crossover junction endodeoxyribonuclease RuvC
MAKAIRILGIDPGLRRTGWGVVDVDGNALRFVAAGTVRSDETTSLADRLCQLHDGLQAVLDLHRPDEAAVEKTVIGVGHGDKKQIQMMVKVLLPKSTVDTADAADALAIAICHAHHRQSAAGRIAAAMAG